MIIVETMVWIDYLNGTTNAHTAWLDRNLTIAEIALTDLVLCEVLQGIQSEVAFARVRRQLMKFTVLSCVGVETSLASAQNYRFLRAKGVTVRKTVDCLIATFCIRGGHSLLHNDRDYRGFEKHLGLKVVYPSPLVH